MFTKNQLLKAIGKEVRAIAHRISRLPKLEYVESLQIVAYEKVKTKKKLKT